MDNIAIVVPTIRKERMEEFKYNWSDLISKHNARLITVWDGDTPRVEFDQTTFDVGYIMGADSDLIYNKNDGVRNLGFAFVALAMPNTDYVITLDDDVSPIGDTIQDHIDALKMKVETEWISTIDDYPRGFPYEIRKTKPVAISHGIWEGVKDWDAPTQLVKGNPDTRYYVGTIPKGVLYPMCGMNIAFNMDMLPYMYYAPMGYRVGLDRFADIWTGIYTKKICDENDWAVVTGYASVLHDRASNVYKNLQKEAKGIELNEGFWKGDFSDPYFSEYSYQVQRWEKFINDTIHS